MKAAVESAITASKDEVRKLSKQVKSVKASLRSSRTETKAAFRRLGHGSGDALIGTQAAITGLLEGASSEVQEYFDRYTEVLSTFNIALFGRTGTGKSSLISALAGLDGERVSPHAASDWTVDVTPVPWNSCRLYDTPGINGWGRTRSVDELERAARRAVEVADVVLLCFDNQSQQASEFTKVAAWVQEFSKPAIAVLNIRNLRWRHPALESESALRSNLQKAVRDHATNIRDNLTAIGMAGVPVVAVHTKHALDARAAQPYVGPDEVNHHRRRADFGVDYLYEWSNLGTLQDLISALVRSGGAELRVTGLREGLRTVFRSWNECLTAEASRITGILDILDDLIAEEFNVFGYPDESGPSDWLKLRGADRDLLVDVEAARGRPYEARKTGRFERHVSQVVGNEMGPLLAESLKEASNCVRDTFDRQARISADEFTARVFDQQAIESASERAWRRSTDFLDRELEMLTNEAVSDITFELGLSTLDGKAGQLNKRVGAGLGVGGIVSGAVSAALVVALAANWWNPVGWVGTLAWGGAAAVSTVLGWLGKKRRAKADMERLHAREQALGQARLSVNEAYQKINEDRSRTFLEEARNTRQPSVRSRLSDWLTIYEAQSAISVAGRDIWLAGQDIATAASGAAVMREALNAVGSSRESKLSADHLLLGEDWIESGADQVELAKMDTPALAVAAERDAEVLSGAVASISKQVPQIVLAPWMDAIQALAESNDAVRALQDVMRLKSHLNPRIVLLGDYSTGKTSLIKRILAERGVSTPKNLKVAGAPTTSEERIVPLGRLDLIDAPGTQSGNTDHDNVARAASSGTAMAIVVLNVNLVIGDHSVLRGFLLGTDSTRAKIGQTVFVIGRSDELGTDPRGMT